jgi:CHAT domain-containing protein/tetratricopeptide (TPR) repeat protein
MHRDPDRSTPWLCVALFWGAAALTAAGAAAGEPPVGLVVEEARAGLAAEVGGLKPGDVLLEWNRAKALPASPEPAHGAFVRAFDVLAVEQEEAQLPEFQVTVLRDGARMTLAIPPGMWVLKVRPPLPDAERETYERGAALLAAADPAPGFAVWNDMASAYRTAGEPAKASWLFFTLARAAVQKRAWPTADAAFAAAREAAGEAGDHVAAGFALTYAGRSLETRGALETAQSRHEEALAEYRAAGGSGLLEGWGLGELARVAYDRSDLDRSETLNSAALAIQQRVAPGSTHVARSLSSLAMAASLRGDLAAAVELDGQALRLLEDLPPGPTDLSTVLNNLGSEAFERGDLASAEEHILRANRLDEAYRSGTSSQANSLTNLGSIASARGDVDASERYHQRALAIQEKLTPGGHKVARILRNLGDLSLRSGDLASADERYARALAMFERWAPEGWDVASTLLDLADVAERRGSLPDAERYARQALAVIEKSGLLGLELAAAFNALGRVAQAKGDLPAAAAHFERALAIRSTVAPGSNAEAESLHALARLAVARGRPDEALLFHLRAIDALEMQRSRVGGSDEAQSNFVAAYAAYYHQTIDLLLAEGRAPEAFHVLERLRARSFLSLLAEKDLAFSKDLPAELDRERRRANVEYDRALAALADGDGADQEGKREALVAARQMQAETRARIRAASPRLATLVHPEPLDLEAVRAALDPGTLLLSYAIGDDASHLFAVGPGPADFRVLTLDTDRRRLRDAVGSFRALLQQDSRLRRGALQAASRELADLLLSPVAPAIARADRVVVVPDGPLHLIPFGALADPLAPGARYLVEVLPLHVAASATVFAEIKKGRRTPGAARLIAFGDPDYGGTGRPAGVVANAVERGLLLAALPSARREVRGIERLFPGARVYVGASATEDEAKSTLGQGSLIHFACHGLAREDAPLDSALALAIPAELLPGRDNGLLQAWEIFEQLRIDAELVTLSACGTALGKEMSGEGILGLTRAFQYAGARSVLASLWAVNDASTAELMRRFYSHLKQGRTKDAALRAAQIEMLRRPASSHPYRWAAFELVGDWR